MQLSAVVLARVVGYVEAFDLVPKGQVFFPDLIREIVAEYQFQKFPERLEENNLSSGVEFLQGRSGSNIIQKFAIYDTLLAAETRSNTNASKAFIDEVLLWCAEKFCIKYRAGTIKRYAYISNLTFYSDAPLLILNPAVTNLTAKISRALSEIWQEPVQYYPLAIGTGHDPTTRKYGIAPFSIERRAEARFSENKYFSEAPLPTDLHLELLEQFEKEMQAAPG